MNNDLNSYSPTKYATLEDTNAVYQALMNLLETRQGERVYRPTFGLPFYNFELMDESEAEALLDTIFDIVQEHEPRVILDIGLSSVQLDHASHGVYVELIFTIASDSSKQKYSISKVL